MMRISGIKWGGLVVSTGLACMVPNPEYDEPGPGTAATGGMSTTTDVGTTGDSTTEEVTSDTDDMPVCNGLGTRKIQIEGIVDPSICEMFGLFVEVDPSDSPTGKVCFNATCGDCLEIPFPIDAPPSLFDDSTCFAMGHWGIWDPDDPEASMGCKTTFVAVFEVEDLEHPIFLGGSRILELPMAFNPDLQFTIEAIRGRKCHCGAECCPDEIATQFDLKFSHGDHSIEVAPGELEYLSLDGTQYALEVLRAHQRGVTIEDACVPLDFYDWHMVRLP